MATLRRILLLFGAALFFLAGETLGPLAMADAAFEPAETDEPDED
jgi:hypothetical protein